MLERTLNGALRPLVSGQYPLEHAAQAQLDVEARHTLGKVTLTIT